MKGNASCVCGTSAFTGSADIRYPYSACMSPSLIFANAVYGNAGYRRRPSRWMPSRMARSNAAKDQLPMPVRTSGVMLVL
ncbi:hypothetical protein D3C86_1979290 [compost metagenome]